MGDLAKRSAAHVTRNSYKKVKLKINLRVKTQTLFMIKYWRHFMNPPKLASQLNLKKSH